MKNGGDMTNPNLTNAELERLAMLSEEAGEITQIIGKILRHGYESFHPARPQETNRALLTREVCDLRAIYSLMVHEGDFLGTYQRHDRLFIPSDMLNEHGRVCLLVEISGRIIKKSGDILLRGMEDPCPDRKGLSNVQSLMNALTDFLDLYKVLQAEGGDLDLSELRVPREVLRRKMPWTKHQDKDIWKEV